MEAFENIFENYFWLAHIIQDTLLIIYNETNIVIYDKISSILKTLNIEEKHPEKFLSRFRTFFQEYFISIFSFTDEILNQIKNKLNKIILSYKNLDENFCEALKKDIESKSFRNLSQIVFKLCIYMLLHEPQLSLNIQPYEKREFSYNFFNKNEYLNIEGFGNEQSACIIILFPPMLRNFFPFQGIKPSVYIIPDPNEEIMKSCEKNRNMKKLPKVINEAEKQSDISPIKLENNIAASLNNTLIPTQKINNTINTSNATASKEKYTTDYSKFNKNFIKEKKISESKNFTLKKVFSNNIESDSLNQCYNHPLSLNKFKKPNFKNSENDETINVKKNLRSVSQNVKTNSINSSKSLNSSMKNESSKLIEFSINLTNNNKTISRRQQTARTTLTNIDQLFYRENISKIIPYIDR